MNIFKNTDLFNIRSFIIVFVTYSLIMIWLASLSVNNDKKISLLVEKVKVLKSEYILSKTLLMNNTKHSVLLEKAKEFEFYSSDKPITIKVLI